MQVKHAYSHFKITLHTFFCRHRKGRIQKIGIQDYRWVKPQELSRVRLSPGGSARNRIP